MVGSLQYGRDPNLRVETPRSFAGSTEHRWHNGHECGDARWVVRRKDCVGAALYDPRRRDLGTILSALGGFRLLRTFSSQAPSPTALQRMQMPRRAVAGNEA